MIVFLAGPLDYWWNENWHTPDHLAYMEWRESIHKQLVEAGHLVYRPDRAFNGAWIEVGQAVNDKALEICDVFVYLTPPGIPAYGTNAERDFAGRLGKRVSWAPPGVTRFIDDLLIRLEDPYGKVHRKSYTKEQENGLG